MGRTPRETPKASTWRLMAKVATDVTTGTPSSSATHLPQRRGRVADEVVRSFGAEVGELGVEHLGGRAHEQPGELVHPLGQVLDAGQEGVPVRAVPRTGLRDAPGEGVGRVVGDLLAPVDQLADQRQRRVGVPVQRETEE